mgnify:CR=1 FL=1
MGPMTGRAAGYCAGFDMPGFMNPIPGRGMGSGWGRGRGRGRGWRHGYLATGLPGWARWSWPLAYGAAPVPGAPQETDALKAQAANLEKALDEIRKRITELETAQPKEG